MVASGRHSGWTKELRAHTSTASMMHTSDWKQGEALSSRSLKTVTYYLQQSHNS